MRPPQELLYDSEASLRLVDNAIEELSVTNSELDSETKEALRKALAEPGGIAVLSDALLRAYAETASLIARFREGAGILDTSGFEKLQQMRGRLHEVSSVTETATNDILNGLARAVGLVEQLDAATPVTDADRHKMAASLREELAGLSNHLQFQDITSQQLVHIAALLGEMRTRLSDVASMFGTAPEAGASRPTPKSSALQDPWSGAAGEAQAVADEIFAKRTPRRTA
jgi:hypothetical protein